MARQGPHHSAQKSTRDNLLESSTSLLKFWSVNSFAMIIFLEELQI